MLSRTFEEKSEEKPEEKITLSRKERLSVPKVMMRRTAHEDGPHKTLSSSSSRAMRFLGLLARP
jgi:hypothetical protein